MLNPLSTPGVHLQALFVPGYANFAGTIAACRAKAIGFSSVSVSKNEAGKQTQHAVSSYKQHQLMGMFTSGTPVAAVIKDDHMVIPGGRLFPPHCLQVPLHAVCAHPVHIIRLGFILHQQPTKDKQHSAILADGVPCAHPAPVVYHTHSTVILCQALRIVCFAPVLHVIAHLHMATSSLYDQHVAPTKICLLAVTPRKQQSR